MFTARVSQGGGQKSISARRISTRKSTTGGTMIRETHTQYQRIVGCPREEAEAHVCRKDLRQEFDYTTQQTCTYCRQIISKKHDTRGEKAVDNVRGKVRRFDMHREKAVDDVRGKVECLRVETAEAHVHLKDLKRRTRDTTRREKVDGVHGEVVRPKDEAEAHIRWKDLRKEVDDRWCHDPRNAHLIPTNWMQKRISARRTSDRRLTTGGAMIRETRT
ncbi:hypothetical protein EDB86DRAFT_2834520 [Lactarius hatsudake]|nr:hypothetical protein EDB86DRAFT_2834520 [Lactarius hatsudake]